MLIIRTFTFHIEPSILFTYKKYDILIVYRYQRWEYYIL